MAKALYLKGNLSEALRYAEKSVKKPMEDFDDVNDVAVIFEAAGKLDKALSQLELCLELKRKQGAKEESIKETENKIAALKGKMN